MSDLLWGFAILAILPAAMFALAFVLTRPRKGRRLEWLVAATALGVICYAMFLWDNILLAKLLPFSNLIVLGNWFPPFLGFLGGLAWNGITGSWLKKGVYLVGMLVLAIFAVVKPLQGTIPDCNDRWLNDVCLQTTPHTCSPCCGATILAHAGIETNEQEMANLCLTNKGTLWQGLFRGLKLKTTDTEWDVEVFTGDVDDLRVQVQDGPVILTVGIPDEPIDEIYTQQYGWSPGELHSAVLFGFDQTEGSENDQRVEMGDPSVEDGREQWSVTDLRVLYRGRGLRLVPR
ncbi:MAG: hypothetical protein KDA84_21635 [Planctomycetaceae bacterium]|nr:hypothetical protein [Planctomycetaceae bacterium]